MVHIENKIKGIIIDTLQLRGDASELSSITPLRDDIFKDFLDVFLVRFDLEDTFDVSFENSPEGTFETVQSISEEIEKLLEEKEES